MQVVDSSAWQATAPKKWWGRIGEWLFSLTFLCACLTHHIVLLALSQRSLQLNLTTWSSFRKHKNIRKASCISWPIQVGCCILLWQSVSARTWNR
jgi:hypothetical protein